MAAGRRIQTTLIIGGKVAKSLLNAFKVTEEQTEQLNKAFDTVSRVGVTAFKAVAGAVASIGTAVIASSEATRDYRKNLAKMYNNAELAGLAQKEAWSGLENLYAMSGEFDSANEAMSQLIATGYKGKDLEKIIEAVNGATVKWQDTISQEGLSDAINETVMSGKSAGQFDEILARSGVNLDTFNDGLLTCSGLAERQQYVLSWLAKSGLTEVNASYQEQNATLVEAYKADLKYQDSLAKVGAASENLGIITKNFTASALSYFAEKLKGVNLEKVSSALKKVGELGKQAFDLLWNALSKIDWETVINAAVTILSVFTSIFNFIVNNWSLISPIIWGIVAAMTAYKTIMLVTKAISVVSTIANAAYLAVLDLMTGGTLKAAAATAAQALAQNGLNLAFLACPLTWILILIGGLVAVFVLLWNKSETFRNAVTKLWESLKGGLAPAIELVKNAFNSVKAVIDSVIQKVESLIGWIKKAATALKDSKIGQAVGGAVGKVKGVVGKITGNALGSTITSPTLTWVGEGGDVETIVPHNNKPRSQALALEAVKGTGLKLGGGSSFVFAPVININGNGNANEINTILEDKFEEFTAKCEAWLSNKRRLSY